MRSLNVSHHLIDRRAISRMQDGVILVNVARGGLIDEVALVEGLRSGRVGVAALDVRATSPLAARDEMRSLPNVILTPHLAATSGGIACRSARLCRQQRSSGCWRGLASSRASPI